MGVLKALETVMKVLTVTEGVAAITDANEAEAQDSGEELEMGNENDSGTLIEQFELETKYLVKRVKELLREGNVRKLVIKDAKGKYLLEVPMTMGVFAGGIFVLYAPVMTALSVVAAAVTKVTIEVVRMDEEAEETDGETAEETEAE